MKLPGQHLLKKEQRKYQRVYLEIGAKVSPAGDGEPIDAVILNIGGGGIKLLLDRELPVVSKVQLEFALPDEENVIKCMGQIIWRIPNKKWYMREPGGYHVGIKFLDLKQEEKAKLVRFVFSRKTR
ncbi:MAG: PilZ domain-containing protein [bacterium]